MGCNIPKGDDDLLDTTPDIAKMSRYREARASIATLVSMHAKGQGDLRVVMFGSISRLLKPEHKPFMVAVLHDLTDAGELKWDETAVAPSRIFVV